MTMSNILPPACLSYVCSFLATNDLSQYATVDKTASEVARYSLENFHFRQIGSFPPNSFLGRLALEEPLETSKEGRAELIKRVVVNADRYLRDHQAILTSEDRRELGIRPRPRPQDPVFNLSFNDLNLCGKRIQENLADTNLLATFKEICSQNPPVHRPRLTCNLRKNASSIRTWLADNAVHLNGITILDLSSLNLTSLPPEILLLNNLHSLVLSGNPIAALPDGFNPPNLQQLDLRNTLIAALPDGFNPPNLQHLDLKNAPIAALPAGFNPPNLQRLYLENTPIAALPDGFNPPNLRGLYLKNTPIAALPTGFNPPNLGCLNLKNTPIAALPTGFNPPNLQHLDLKNAPRSAFWSKGSTFELKSSSFTTALIPVSSSDPVISENPPAKPNKSIEEE